MVNMLTITFSTTVTQDLGAIEVDKQGGGAEGIVVNSSTNVSGQTVATVTFTGADIIAGSLGDGRYTLVIHAAKVHDTQSGQELDGGTDHVEQFWRLFGDAKGTATVDNGDLAIFYSTYRKHSTDAGFLWYMDYNGDGVVDVTDYAQFRLRYGTSI